MKIIGGYDYYDGAGWGIDPDILFLRQERVIEPGPFQLPRPLEARDGRARLHFFFLLIGGEVMPGVREQFSSIYAYGYDRNGRRDAYPGRQDPRDVFHYDIDAAMQALEAITPPERKRMSFLFRSGSDEIAAHFAAPRRAARTDWMITERVSTGVIERGGYRGTEPAHARINCSDLARLEAYRVCDPASAHMKISAWIGGVLPSGPETVEISDTSKLRKAGFDDRTSFRQSPGVKKPRRRKAGRG